MKCVNDFPERLYLNYFYNYVRNVPNKSLKTVSLTI